MAVAGLLVLAFSAFLLLQLVTAYGAARYAAGRAEAEAAQWPTLVAAHDAAARAGLAARERLIAADNDRLGEMTRMLPHILAANDKVNAYASTDAGGAPCLAADRVRGIEADRVSLFPDAAAPGHDDAGSLSAEGFPGPARSQPE